LPGFQGIALELGQKGFHAFEDIDPYCNSQFVLELVSEKYTLLFPEELANDISNSFGAEEDPAAAVHVMEYLLPLCTTTAPLAVTPVILCALILPISEEIRTKEKFNRLSLKL
jgi:hypothetical protein